MKRTWKTTGLLILVAGLLLLTACGEAGRDGSWFRNKQEQPFLIRTETPGRMTAFELVQTVVLAVNDDIPVGQAYESIPARQRNDLTLSSFTRYVALIRRAARNDVTGFSVLDDTAKAALVSQTSAQSAALAELSASGTFFQLHFLDETRRETTFTIAVQQLDGLPALASAWVDAVLRLNDYVQLYFAAIDSADEAALKALLRQGEVTPPTKTMDAALLNKSRDTISFYKRRVITAPLDYKLIGLLPGQASVEHYATVSQGSTRRENRTVTFSDTNGIISVLDKVPSELNLQDLEVYVNNTKLFVIGSETEKATSDVFEQQIGIPLSHTSQNCRIVNGAAAFQFRFRGLVIAGSGTCERHLAWQGVIMSASLSYSQFRLGSGLRAGMPVSELYVRYPFARESNYVITGHVDDKPVSLAVQVEQGYITKLTVTETP